MGILLAYLAETPVTGCGSVPELQVDLGHPGPPPLARVPLARAPKGPVRRVTSTAVGDFAFVNGRVEIARKSRFTWNFIGPSQHNVTLASGPVGFSSPTVTRAHWSHRFTRPGVYRLVCSLHPVSMTQLVRVR
jgi:plastocyanin